MIHKFRETFSFKLGSESVLSRKHQRVSTLPRTCSHPVLGCWRHWSSFWQHTFHHGSQASLPAVRWVLLSRALEAFDFLPRRNESYPCVHFRNQGILPQLACHVRNRPRSLFCQELAANRVELATQLLPAQPETGGDTRSHLFVDSWLWPQVGFGVLSRE